MANSSRAFGYLLAFPVEALALITFGWLGGNWLNANHPISFNWFIITFPLAFIGIVRSVYVLIKSLNKTVSNDKNI